MQKLGKSFDNLFYWFLLQNDIAHIRLKKKTITQKIAMLNYQNSMFLEPPLSWPLNKTKINFVTLF